MRSLLRRPLPALLALALLVAGPVAGSAETRVGEIEVPPASAAWDAVILRPCGLLATAVGVVLAIPATFFTALGRPGDIPKVWDILVVEPAKYTFVDEIGTH
jgi:hypothetical protein